MNRFADAIARTAMVALGALIAMFTTRWIGGAPPMNLGDVVFMTAGAFVANLIR